MSDKSEGIVYMTPAGNPVNHGGSGSAYTNYGCRCQACTEAHNRRVERRRRERHVEVATGNATGFKHGVGGYSNWGCRCDVCRAAQHEAVLAGYASRKERVRDAPHGTAAAYSGWGCRCDGCTAAAKASRQERGARDA